MSAPYTLAEARWILSHVYCCLCCPEAGEAGFATRWFPGVGLAECCRCRCIDVRDLRLWVASESAARAWLEREATAYAEKPAKPSESNLSSDACLTLQPATVSLLDMKTTRPASRLDILNAQLATLETEIATAQAHYDASYDAALAAEAAGDVEATARHDAWLAVFDSMLTSLRASLHLGQREHNELLLATEAA